MSLTGKRITLAFHSAEQTTMAGRFLAVRQSYFRKCCSVQRLDGVEAARVVQHGVVQNRRHILFSTTNSVVRFRRRTGVSLSRALEILRRKQGSPRVIVYMENGSMARKRHPAGRVGKPADALLPDNNLPCVDVPITLRRDSGRQRPADFLAGAVGEAAPDGAMRVGSRIASRQIAKERSSVSKRS